MNPKHKNPTKPYRIAHAPYNFVPLPEKVVTVEEKSIPGQNAYTGNTGYIDCELITETPLYTRPAMAPEFFRQYGDKDFDQLGEAQKGEIAQFFSAGRPGQPLQPVIPGSSLRGMVRSLMEIAGYGKMQWVTGESLFFRAVGDTSSISKLYRDQLIKENKRNDFEFLMKAGYLCGVGNKWFIRPAVEINGVSFGRIEEKDIPNSLSSWHNCRNSYKIYVKLDTVRSYLHNKNSRPVTLHYAKVSKVSNQHNDGLTEMILVKTGKGPRKHLQFVFGLPSEKKLSLENNLIKLYRDQITQGQENLLGKDGALYDMQPVFYLEDKGRIVFFGHTMMFRLPYQKTPFSFVPEHLRVKTNIDLAEAIFGYEAIYERDTGKKIRGGRAGQVFFTDAHVTSVPDGGVLFDTPVTPQILGSPKPTAFQHYLTQQEPDEKSRLDHYSSPPPHETVIRGHKLYWHKKGTGIEDIKEPDQEKIQRHSSQYTLVRPVRPGVKFSFRIYFENLTSEELGALLWVLVLPGEAGKQYRHKLGMGKPLGMGSVRVKPVLHLVDRRTRYERLLENGKWYQGKTTNKSADDFIAAFEKYILCNISPVERGGKKHLAEVPRIRMLVKMLEWPGPDPAKTQYMDLSEFKERKVLSDPLN
ncbi:MAG: TIGR03986 family type III CRISPR-associated RAMP protein [Bacillota bacterium]